MKNIKLAPLALAVISALSVAACGGGGGNNDDGGTGGNGGGNGGGSGSGSNVVPASSTTIDVTQADGVLALGTPDAAAKAGAAALVASANAIEASNPSAPAAAAAKAAAKAATACSDGGTRDIATSGTTTTITYDNCIEGDFKQDGKLASSLTSLSTTNPQGSYSFGETNAPYLTEILNPAADRFRSLLEGTGDYSVELDGSFMPTHADYSYRLKGAAINLAHAATPRADFELGNSGTAFSGSADFSGTHTELSFSGPYKVASYCGSGAGTINTPTPLKVDNGSGAITEGQVTITSGSAMATYTYNSDGTVTIDTAGGTQTYTQAQLEAACPL